MDTVVCIGWIRPLQMRLDKVVSPYSESHSEKMKVGSIFALFSVVHSHRVTRGLSHELVEEEVCYPDLGCFDNKYPFDCLGTRNLPSDRRQT